MADDAHAEGEGVHSAEKDASEEWYPTLPARVSAALERVHGVEGAAALAEAHVLAGE